MAYKGATTESFCLQKVYDGVHFTSLYDDRPVLQKSRCREPSEAGITGADEHGHAPERKTPGGELRFRPEEQRQVYCRSGERGGDSRLQVLTLAIRP
ncbi:hypothetical protein JFK57_17100 [Escherichia coli]|nr:hypothetical protein [Escherichia coli]